MTILLPKENLLDWILGLLGKKRGYVVPKMSRETVEKYGRNMLIRAKKESFIRALLRRKK